MRMPPFDNYGNKAQIMGIAGPLRSMAYIRKRAHRGTLGCRPPDAMIQDARCRCGMQAQDKTCFVYFNNI